MHARAGSQPAGARHGWSEVELRSIVAKAAAGSIAAAVVSAIAYRARALTPGGAVAATVIGGTVVAGAGWRSGAAVVAFFVSSALLGRLPRAESIEQRRGNRRDAVQVLANGGVAAALAISSLVVPRRLQPRLVAGVFGAIAAATADTWATEIGSRCGGRPRSIINGTAVSAGTSGGVTIAGLVASVAGSTALAAVAAAGLARGAASRRPPLSLPVAMAGMTGSLVDSVLGATIQQVSFCPVCARESELFVHHCGARTSHLRGARWCDNDMVNALATATGAAAATLLTRRPCPVAQIRARAGDSQPAHRLRR